MMEIVLGLSEVSDGTQLMISFTDSDGKVFVLNPNSPDLSSFEPRLEADTAVSGRIPHARRTGCAKILSTN